MNVGKDYCSDNVQSILHTQWSGKYGDEKLFLIVLEYLVWFVTAVNQICGIWQMVLAISKDVQTSSRSEEAMGMRLG